MRTPFIVAVSIIALAAPALAETKRIIRINPAAAQVNPAEPAAAPEAAPEATPEIAPAEALETPGFEASTFDEPVVADAGPTGPMITATDPMTVVQALQDYGVAAKLEADDQGDPVIRVKIGGASSNVYFYGCDDNGADCRSLSFSAGFELDAPYTVEQANEWNINKRFSKSYVTEDGAAQLEMDVNMIAGGVNAENFADTIDWWDYSISEYKEFIGW